MSSASSSRMRALASRFGEGSTTGFEASASCIASCACSSRLHASQPARCSSSEAICSSGSSP